LREGGTSLLPVGIVGVEGEFDAGDAVSVRRGDGAVVGKGIASYSAEGLRLVMGRKSAEVREILPRATEEARHRGYLLLAWSPLGARRTFRLLRLDPVASVTTSVADLCLSAKAAARRLAAIDSNTKNAALLAIAAALEARVDEILEANARDLEAGRESGLSDALMDRLRLDRSRVRGMADGVRAIVALPDPVGEVVDGGRLASGL